MLLEKKGEREQGKGVNVLDSARKFGKRPASSRMVVYSIDQIIQQEKFAKKVVK